MHIGGTSDINLNRTHIGGEYVYCLMDKNVFVMK